MRNAEYYAERPCAHFVEAAAEPDLDHFVYEAADLFFHAFVMLGQYDEAVKRYDRALALRPGWQDAATNREIARIRGDRKKLEGGVTDDTESKPDEIVFDKTKKGGEDTTLEKAGAPMSDDAVRALWLKRVQTKPADFLRVKFSYQLQSQDVGKKP